MMAGSAWPCGGALEGGVESGESSSRKVVFCYIASFEANLGLRDPVQGGQCLPCSCVTTFVCPADLLVMHWTAPHCLCDSAQLRINLLQLLLGT